MSDERYRERKRRNGRDFRARIYADPEKYAAYREKCREYESRYREKRRAILLADPVLLAEHKAKHKRWKSAYDSKQRRRKAEDAEFYSLYRAERRAVYAMKRRQNGKVYRGLPSMRVPDWEKFGQKILDASSPWLVENLTPSQRGYARELAIERKEWRMDNEWRMAR